jgi:hypothetical protein
MAAFAPNCFPPCGSAIAVTAVTAIASAISKDQRCAERRSVASLRNKLAATAIGAFPDILHPFRYSPRDTLR